MRLTKNEWYWFKDKETGQISEHGRYKRMDGCLDFAGTPKLLVRKKEANELCARSECVVKILLVEVKP